MRLWVCWLFVNGVHDSGGWACRICYVRAMPPGRKPSLTREDFVTAAITYADDRGIDALSLRELGRAMGVSATAVYRYFPDKEALIVEVRETLLGQMLGGDPPSTDPRTFVLETALAYRRVARAHPCLSQVMVLAALDGETAGAVPGVVAQALDALGLRGQALVLAYRQLESLVIGATAFDFANAPQHLEQRLARMQKVDRSDFREVFRDVDDVKRINEEAFAASVLTLVESWVARNASVE